MSREGIAIREVEPAALAAAVQDGARVVDVREPEEYVTGHVPGAVNIPLGTLPARTSQLRAGERVFVICAGGGRSLQAAQLLSAAGVEALSVAGGTSAWARGGHPLVTGNRANVS